MKTALKMIAVLVLAAFLLTTAACTGDNKKGSEKGAVVSKHNKIVVGFSQVGEESDWRIANSQSIISAAREADIELIFSNAMQKPENQIKAIRSFIAQQVDVIAFSPIVETGWDAVLDEAKVAGIPVIVMDRAIDIKDKSLYVTYIGSDFLEEGKKAGKWLVETMKEEKVNINIVELQGNFGSAPAIGRRKGFEEIIKINPKMRIIRSQAGDFMKSKGKEIMEQFLKYEGNNIHVIFAHNDDMALGAIEAVEEFGLRPGKDIIIISVDAVKAAFEAMIAGKLNCTVECNPLQGPALMDAVKSIVEGKELPKRIVIEEGIFPQEVAERELPNRKY